MEFYPTITEKILDDALAFSYRTLGLEPVEKEIEIIKNARKAFLFSKDKNENSVWVKKKGSFDVTMGAPDGAELCELIGLFMLDQIQTNFPDLEVGLYRDDGLATYKQLPGPKVNRIRKDLHALFNNHGLKITVESNMKTVNFLDVTLNLSKGLYEPYKKPNDTPLYLHVGSNHPNAVKKAVPLSVNQRLSSISSSAEEFKKAAPEYQKALHHSGHKHTLVYKEENENDKDKRNISKFVKKLRKRNIVWFNPPFNAGVKTNVGKKFLQLVDKHFPPDHKLRQVVNRNCVKLSYSCMKNVKQIIQSHNQKVMTQYYNKKTDSSMEPNRTPKDTKPVKRAQLAPVSPTPTSYPVDPQNIKRKQPKRTCKKDAPIELPVSPQNAQIRTSPTIHPPANSEVNSSSTKKQTQERTCNCRKKEQCPLDGKCNNGPIVYKATISGGQTEKIYIGCTEEYKKRLANHKLSFKNTGKKNATRLSKYVWSENLHPNPNIKWELVRYGWPYKPGGRICDLCLTEKMIILTEHKNNKHDLLNLRNESTDRCVHKLKFRLNRI